MATQRLQQVSPSPVKLEYSPAESWVSLPGDPYPSLFAVTTPSASDSTINPLDVLTPRSESRCVSEERQSCGLSAIPEEAQTPSGSEKKPTKKRKSWGQVLPEPKTNLPPRKRAKTEDEKEQRRVERVLRNRRAAQSSRERKRLEVEALEQQNKELLAKVAMLENNQRVLTEELTRLRQEFGVATPSTSPLRMMPVTLSQELFSSQDAQVPVTTASNPLAEPRLSTSKTINPASLSPELRPVADVVEPAQKQAKQPKQSKATEPSGSSMVPSPDVTQRPAVMLSDLPCHMSAETLQSSLASRTLTQPVLDLLPQLLRMLLSALATPSPSTSRAPNLKPADLKPNLGFSPLPLPPSMMNSWSATLPSTSATLQTLTSSTSLSTTSQSLLPQSMCQRATMPLRTTASTAKSSTFKIEFLQNILSSSPSLARPLVDATMAALRLVSERPDEIVGNFKGEFSGPRGDDELTRCLGCIALSSDNELLKGNRRSIWYELVAQNLQLAITTQEQLGQDEFTVSDLVHFNNPNKLSTAKIARHLEKAMMGQWRLMESRGSKVNNIPRKGSDNQVWGSLEFEMKAPMAQPSDLTHLMSSPHASSVKL